ncbi:MAG: hypothetical protein R3F62_00015 [Planctomycetota bacterium]
MRAAPAFAALATCLLCATPLAAAGAGAVLVVEDNPVTERLFAKAYEAFLTESGAYAEVRVLQGDEGKRSVTLAAAIRELAPRVEQIDVVISAHTTRRDPALLAKLLPPAARKLRLVYSTACYGADAERPAWEGVGARTVVTHVGINNPIVALPYFLGEWTRGAPVGRTLAAGYREESECSRFVLSLPGVGKALRRVYGHEGGEPEFLSGSRPVLSGAGDTTIQTGLEEAPTLLHPEGLRYVRSRGSSPGLFLRALAGRFDQRGTTLQDTLSLIGLPEMPWFDPELMTRLRVVDVYERRAGRGPFVAPRREGEVVVSFARAQSAPLDAGFTLHVGKTVRFRFGQIDPGARKLVLKVSGLWAGRGLLRCKVTSLTFSPTERGGYRVRLSGLLWGVVPFWRHVVVGGETPAPLPADLTVLAAADHEANPGIVDGLGPAPTQK